jgi:hypothetical protein
MKHQIVTSKFPTLERQALNRVRKQFPRLKRRGFATAAAAVGGVAYYGEVALKALPAG